MATEGNPTGETGRQADAGSGKAQLFFLEGGAGQQGTEQHQGDKVIHAGDGMGEARHQAAVHMGAFAGVGDGGGWQGDGGQGEGRGAGLASQVFHGVLLS